MREMRCRIELNKKNGRGHLPTFDLQLPSSIPDDTGSFASISHCCAFSFNLIVISLCFSCTFYLGAEACIASVVESVRKDSSKERLNCPKRKNSGSTIVNLLQEKPKKQQLIPEGVTSSQGKDPIENYSDCMEAVRGRPFKKRKLGDENSKQLVVDMEALSSPAKRKFNPFVGSCVLSLLFLFFFFLLEFFVWD
ncbi:MAG: hypothetical protein GY821_08615 [Gammaproteobacteria bacterium]|nr:hypothetical protein [Gammaproteobacteria bacterium]